MREKDEIIRQLRSVKAARIINKNEVVEDGTGLGGMSRECQEDVEELLTNWEDCLEWVLGLSDVPAERGMSNEELLNWDIKEIKI